MDVLHGRICAWPETEAQSDSIVSFADVTFDSGVRFRHEAGFSGHKLLPETMGGGVAVFDYDGDGKPDILLVNGRAWPGNEDPAVKAAPTTPKLYRNLGGMKFEDVTQQAGLDVTLYGMGVAVRALCRLLDYVGINYHIRDFNDIRAARGF